MAIKQFAIPLDDQSDEQGDINFKALASAGASADFTLTNVASGMTSEELNLITKKNGATKDHHFSVTVSGGTAKTTLSTSDLNTVYGDAAGGDWDYVEAKWTLGAVDTPDKSNMKIYQSGRSYNYYGWPPNG